MTTTPTFATHQPVADRDKRTIRPVSADETLREYGRHGRRSPLVNIWRNIGVRPKLATAGITVGGKIRTWRGIIEVTRVGTIAGFGMLNGREERWDISEVREIIVPS